jgi:hypothetical protein
MFTYTLIIAFPACNVLRSDGAYIPLDFNNTDFQDFIRWLQAGNALPGLPPVQM